jgi:DNA-binding Lrp family transcriptional regulator
MRRQKNVELKLISELIKNSRRSDRELAQAIGVSQPTITRTRARLEKEGYIKEYTMVPDFLKLGFEIAAMTFFNFTKERSDEEIEKSKEMMRELQKQHPVAALVAASGWGIGSNRAWVSFHENYSSYVKTLEILRQIPYVDMSHIESFVISLHDEEHFLPFSFKTIANYLSAKKEKE